MCCVLRFVGCDRTYATMTAEKTAIVSWRIRFATRLLRKSVVTESREPFYTWCCSWCCEENKTKDILSVVLLCYYYYYYYYYYLLIVPKIRKIENI